MYTLCQVIVFEMMLVKHCCTAVRCFTFQPISRPMHGLR